MTSNAAVSRPRGVKYGNLPMDISKQLCHHCAAAVSMLTAHRCQCLSAPAVQATLQDEPAQDAAISDKKHIYLSDAHCAVKWQVALVLSEHADWTPWIKR